MDDIPNQPIEKDNLKPYIHKLANVKMECDIYQKELMDCVNSNLRVPTTYQVGSRCYWELYNLNKCVEFSEKKKDKKIKPHF